jgi:hypothetical protein
MPFIRCIPVKRPLLGPCKIFFLDKFGNLALSVNSLDISTLLLTKSFHYLIDKCTCNFSVYRKIEFCFENIENEICISRAVFCIIRNNTPSQNLKRCSFLKFYLDAKAQSQLLGPFRQSSDKDLEHNSMNTQNGYGILV